MVPETSSLVFLQYLTTVFDNITDAILLIGIEKGGFRLLTANSAFFAMSGYPQDVVGKDVADVVRPASYSFIVKQYKRVIKTKRPVEYTQWADMPIGRRCYDVRVIPILNTVGEPVQLAAIAHDSTEWMNAQEELGRLREKQHMTIDESLLDDGEG